MQVSPIGSFNPLEARLLSILSAAKGKLGSKLQEIGARRLSLSSLVGKLKAFEEGFSAFKASVAGNMKVEFKKVPGFERDIRVGGFSVDRVFENKVRISGLALETGDRVELEGSIFFVEKVNERDYRLFASPDLSGAPERLDKSLEGEKGSKIVRYIVPDSVVREETIDFNAIGPAFKRLAAAAGEVSDVVGRDFLSGGLEAAVGGLDSRAYSKASEAESHASRSLRKAATEEQAVNARMDSLAKQIAKLKERSEQDSWSVVGLLRGKKSNIGFLAELSRRHAPIFAGVAD